jgi:tRNA threonylcarbamoyladenosine biosynthesis protein TsaE
MPNESAFPPSVTRVATDADMRLLGRRLAAVLQPGDLVILAGPLGAGKTTLVQGIGAGLGSISEVDDLDLDTDVASAVTVVEWGSGLVEGLAEDRLEISIEPDQDSDVRTVTINGIGARWHAVLAGAADRL